MAALNAIAVEAHNLESTLHPSGPMRTLFGFRLELGLVGLTLIGGLFTSPRLVAQTPSPRASDVVFQRTGEALTQGEGLALDELVRQLNTVLPVTIKSALSVRPIELQIKTLPDRVQASHQSNRIEFNRALLQRLVSVANPNQSPFDGAVAQSHRSVLDYALATLIHEVAHAYDFLNVQTAKRSAEIQFCRDQEQFSKDTGPRGLEISCRKLINVKTSVSTQPDFLSAIDYTFDGVQYQKSNYLESRSMDPYEFKNPAENFAVNMEYFLLDPEFQCRKPSLSKVLSRHLGGHIPFPEKHCSTTDAVLLSGSAISGGAASLVSLDATRIYSVDYLLAGKGDDAMSKYGHAMLRLQICSPDRRVVNEECSQDLMYHVVLSFRASVEDLQVDKIKGLIGKYPSMLFVLPLTGVIDEYTKGEFREVTALPLKLTEAEKHKLVQKAIEMHWNYEGRYKFLSNNCAHESLNLLKRSLSKNKKLQELDVLRPDTLFEMLEDIGLGNSGALADRTEAQKSGHYFPSKRESYARALAVLEKQGVVTQSTTLEQYLALEPDVRLQLALKKTGGDLKRIGKQGLAALYMIEDLALIRAKKAVMEEALRNALQSTIDLNGEGAKENSRVVLKQELDQARALMKLFSSPSNLLAKTARYGVPTKTEVEEIATNPDLLAQLESTKGLEEKIETGAEKLVSTEKLERARKTKVAFAQIIQAFRSVGK